MSMENGIAVEQRISHVEAIVEQFPEVAGLQVYEYFRNNAQAQKDEFIDRDKEQLDLEYPDLTYDAVASLKDPMLESLTTLMQKGSTDKSKALYSTIEYRYSELFMMDLSKVMNSKETREEDRDEARIWFKSSNEGLYGKPEANIFSALARKKILSLLKAKEDDDQLVQSMRSDLDTLIGEVEDTDYETFTPSEELVSRIGTLVHERFNPLVDHINPEKEYTAVEIAEVLQTAVDKIGAAEMGWQVKIVPNSSAMAVSAHQKQVEVGENRPNINGLELRGKIIHEVGVHTGRSINAERAGWLSAAYGLDGYLDFEESFATALEDAYKDKFSNHGENYYLVAGLAYGLDNHEPRNFREVYEIMWRTNVLSNKKGLNDETVKKAQSSAFTTCLRMFRGTDTSQQGIVYLKDLAYFKGQELAWGFLKNIEDQEDFDIAFTGKLDPTQPDHLDIAKKILKTKK